MAVLVAFFLIAPVLALRGFMANGGWVKQRVAAKTFLPQVATLHTPDVEPNENRWVNREGVMTIAMDEYLPGDAGLSDLSEEPSAADMLGFLSEEEPDLHPISTMTLNDIAETYFFSVHYLGDFVSQMGVPTPIDFDVEIRQLLDSNQQSTLMEAVNSLDPFDCNDGYHVSVQELADEFGVSIDEVEKACASQKIRLPMGRDSVLHQTLVESVKGALGAAS